MGDHCQFCRANLPGYCPLQDQTATEVANQPPVLDALDEETMGSWLDRVAAMEGFIKNLGAHAHKEVDRGIKIPGWGLKPKRGSLVYADKEKAEKILRRHLKVKGAFTKQLISPPQAEKALGKEKYKKVLADHVTSVSSGYNLAKVKAGDPEKIVEPQEDLKTLAEATEKEIAVPSKSLFEA